MHFRFYTFWQRVDIKFPGGSDGKAPAYNVGYLGSIPGLGSRIHVCVCVCTHMCFPGSERSWRRQWHPTPVLLPGKSHGRRSLVGYSPWGRNESDTTEQLRFHFMLRHRWSRAYLRVQITHRPRRLSSDWAPGILQLPSPTTQKQLQPFLDIVESGYQLWSNCPALIMKI